MTNDGLEIVDFLSRSSDKIVEIIYIRLVMFSRMVFECFLRNNWLESIEGVAERWFGNHSMNIENDGMSVAEREVDAR